MGSFRDKQPTYCVCVRARARAHVCKSVQTQLRSLSGMRWEEKDKRYLCLTWQMTNKWRHAHASIHTYTHVYARVTISHGHTHTHPPHKFVWKVTEVSHCHYTAYGCHFIVSHQYITQTKKMCSHIHVQAHTRSHAHCYHTKLTKSL